MSAEDGWRLFFFGLLLGGPAWILVAAGFMVVSDFLEKVERKWQMSSWRKAIRQSRVERLKRKAKKLEDT